MVTKAKTLRPDAVACMICKLDGKEIKADSLITHLCYHHPGVGLAEYEQQYGPGIAPSLRKQFKTQQR